MREESKSQAKKKKEKWDDSKNFCQKAIENKKKTIDPKERNKIIDACKDGSWLGMFKCRNVKYKEKSD